MKNGLYIKMVSYLLLLLQLSKTGGEESNMMANFQKIKLRFLTLKRSVVVSIPVWRRVKTWSNFLLLTEHEKRFYTSSLHGLPIIINVSWHTKIIFFVVIWKHSALLHIEKVVVKNKVHNGVIPFGNPILSNH